ncbi:MAG: retropepsin-like aspartic protease [Bacteroidota bacterium]
MLPGWRYLSVFMCIMALSDAVYAQSYYVEIPYEELRGKIIIPARVGRFNGDFILDTGSEFTLISSELAGQLSDSNIDTSYVRDATGRQTSFAKMVLPSIRPGSNGPLNFANLPVLILEPEAPIYCYEVDGIIGNDILKHCVVRIDSPNKRVILTNSVDSFNISSRSYKNILHNKLPIIQVGLNRLETDEAVFDSGSNGFFEMCSASYDKVGFDDVMTVNDTGFGATYMGVGGIENSNEKIRIQIPYFTIGIGKFQKVNTITTSAKRSRLGTKILEYGIVTIDYPNSRFYYEPVSQTPVLIDEKIWNAGITVSDNHLIIGMVWSGMNEHLKGGEQVLSINGQDVSVIDPCKALISKVVQMDGDTANITIKDAEGNIKELVLLKIV